MASSQQPTPIDVHNVEVFTILTLKYLDGVIEGEELAALETALRDSAPRRDQFVQLCQLHACLLEAFHLRREHVRRTPAEGAQEPSGEDTVLRSQKADDTVRVANRPAPGPKKDGAPAG